MKKIFIVSLVGGFGIMTGLEIRDMLEPGFSFEENYKTIISCVLYFSMMMVMFREWIKILGHEEKKRKSV